jgi:hypothetical protein
LGVADAVTLAVRKAVVIDRAIVHRVYDEAGKRSRPDVPPLLSGAVTPLDAEAESFLRDHITGSQGDYRARRGAFDDPDHNAVLAACDAIFASPTSEEVFVEQSQAIARRLFEAMRGQEHMDARISTGDLIVCLVDAVAGDGHRTPLVALLKIDPQIGFVGDIEPGPAGTRRIVLRRVGAVLTDSRLQKCAFVLPPAERARAGHDLAVLDLQTDRRSTSRWAASYFVEKFLDCTVGLSADEQLRIFVYDGGAWIDQQPWPEEQKIHIKDQVIAATFNPTIDVVAFAQQAIADDSEREAYLDHLRDRGLADLVFQPDPERRRRLAEFVSYEGDGDLRLRARRADYGPGRRVEPTRNADGSVTVCFRTSRWREVR